MHDPMKHNYVKKLLQLQREGKLPEPGTAIIDVCHDHWCGIHKGRYCNCEPEIVVRKLEELDVERN